MAGRDAGGMVWVGRILSALPTLVLLGSGVAKILKRPEVIALFHDKFGFSIDQMPRVGALEIGCALIYAIPRTAPLGAILITGFLGGAVAAHVRVSDPPWGPLAVAILPWLGLYVRERRLRALVPFRDMR
jgi:hypothetical protein